jgi:hypothetical protein
MTVLGIILWIALSIVLAYLGQRTRIGFWGVFFCSILFSPLIMAIALFLSIPRKVKTSS